MRGWIFPASGILLAILVIAGCSSSTPQPQSTATLAVESSFPTGIFKNGDWTWEFKDDGSTSSTGPMGSENGTYSVDGNQLVITCECCGNVAGVYSWAYDGEELTFTPVEDQCNSRMEVVISGPWSIQS